MFFNKLRNIIIVLLLILPFYSFSPTLLDTSFFNQISKKEINQKIKIFKIYSKLKQIKELHINQNFNEVYNYMKYIDDLSDTFNLDEKILYSIVMVESGFEPNIKNKNKDKHKSIDYGLFQINGYYHRKVYKKYDFKNNPYDNIKYGIIHFSDLNKKFSKYKHTLSYSLIAYNRGTGYVLKNIKLKQWNALFENEYRKKVLYVYNKIK